MFKLPSYAASRLWKRRYATKSSQKTTTISTVTSPSSFWAQTFKKVTAYPFTVNPREAQVLMDSLLIVVRNWPLKLFYTRPEGVLVKLLSHYVRFKSRNDPLRVKAVYVPIWRLFAYISFTSLDSNRKLLGEKCITLGDVHIPGTHTPVHLSSKPIWHLPKIEYLETAPIGECIKPFGMDAQCLPFTISPFSPFDLAKSIENKPLPAQQQPFLVLPSTIYPEFYAAFPVMIPVYVGEYQWATSSGKGRYSFVCEAFGMEPRIANLETDRTIDDDADGEIKVIWWRTFSNHINKLATMPILKTDDDPCIRPLKQEELDPVLRYHKMRRSLSEWLRLDTDGWPINRQNEYIQETRAKRARVLEYIPSWWKESKLCPESLKKSPESEDKPKRPAKSRSSPI